MSLPEPNERIDNSMFESVVMYNLLCAPFRGEYMAMICEHIKKKGIIRNESKFKFVTKMIALYEENNRLPNIKELRLRFVGETEREIYNDVIDKAQRVKDNYDIGQLMKDTENFIKSRMADIAFNDIIEQQHEKGNYNSDAAFEMLAEANNVSLVDGIGLDLFEQIDLHLARAGKEESHISTGYDWLDNHLGGGFLECGRALYTFGGWTNVGKSMFLANILANVVKNNKRVVLISLEMSEDVYARRIMTMLSGIHYAEYANKQDELRGWVSKHKDANKDSRIIIKEFPPRSISTTHVKGYLNRLKRLGYDFDIVAIDYSELLLPPRNFSGRPDLEIQYIAEEVRALSYTFEVPFLDVIQLSKESLKSDTPGLEASANSTGRSRTIDFQANLSRTEEDEEMGWMKINIAKTRFGKGMKSSQNRLILNPENLRITEDSKITKIEEDRARKEMELEMNAKRMIFDTLDSVKDNGGVEALFDGNFGDDEDEFVFKM